MVDERQNVDHKDLSENSQDDDLLKDDGVDSEVRRERRLMQNRKSAKKCRLKKKAEFNCLKDDIEATIRENGELKIKVSELTMLLYQKIEENNVLQRRIEQVAS